VCGAIPGKSFLEMMQKTGFSQARIIGTTGYRTSQYTMGTLFLAQKP